MVSEKSHEDVVDNAVTSSFVVLSVVSWFLMDAVSSNGDAFDADLYWSTWLILPLLVAIAAAVWPDGHGPPTWSAALFVPWMAIIAWEGINHDPTEGASFWIVGEIFTLVQLGWAFLVGFIGYAIGESVRSARNRASD